MATDINVVMLVGRLTRDSEVRVTNGGTSVSRFSLAVNRKKRTGDQWEDEVSYIDVVLWGKQADTLKQYLLKGRQVAVSGELRQNRWEQDGQQRSKIEVVANNIELLGTGAAIGEAEPAGRPQGRGNSQSQQSYSGPENFEDADIPF